MALECDGSAFESQTLVELAVLECVDRIVYNGPEHAAYIKRHADAEVGKGSHRRVADEHPRVECEAQDELGYFEDPLHRWVNEHDWGDHEAVLDALPGELEENSKVESHERSQEHACLERRDLARGQGPCLGPLNVPVNVSVQEVVDDAASRPRRERPDSEKPHHLQRRN